MLSLQVLLSSVIVTVFGLQLPDSFQICKLSDPDLAQCLKTAIQDALPLVKDGLPEFNFPSIEPIEIEALTIEQGANAVHMVQNYKNVKLHGISKAKLNTVDLQHNENEVVLTLHAHFDELRLESDYDLNGRFMVMPVSGKGKSVTILRDVSATSVIKTKHRKKKGVLYSNIEEFLVTIKPKKVETHFDNLFDGDKAMGDEVNRVMNENWEAVFEDVKDSYETALGIIFKNIVANIYNKVPFNEMFPICAALSQTDKEILDEILSPDKYDPRVRPPGENGSSDAATMVHVNMYVRSISSVDDVKMQYTVQLNFRQQWVDERLKYNDTSGRYITLNKPKLIWMPDLFFSNENEARYHDVMVPNLYVRIFSNGGVFFSRRLSLTLGCPMNLKSYPMDHQVCTMRMASYGYTTADLAIFWKKYDPVQVVRNLDLPNFSLQTWTTDDCNSRTNTGMYSCLKVDFVFKRHLLYHFLRVYIPTTMLLIISWTSFWFEWSSTAPRMMLSLLTLLTMALYGSFVTASMPIVSYTKAIDVWIGVCTIFAFATHLEFATVQYLSRSSNYKQINDQEEPSDGDALFTDLPDKGEKKCTLRRHIQKLNFFDTWSTKFKTKAKSLDVASRIAFPALFAIFNFIYWIAYFVCNSQNVPLEAYNRLLLRWHEKLIIDKSSDLSEQELIEDIKNLMPNFPISFWNKNKNKSMGFNSTCANFPTMFHVEFSNVYWQTLRTTNGTFQLYGAYLDNRVSNRLGPTVRILGMIDRIEPNVTTYCHFWFDGKMEPVIAESFEYKYIWHKKWGNYKQGIYQPYLIACVIPRRYKTVAPLSISLVERACDNSTNNMRVMYNKPVKEKKDFAVCVKGLDFPHEDVSVRLVEWIELLNLLGADKIFFYELQVHPNISKVLGYYEKKEKVKVTPINLAGGQPNGPSFQHLYLIKNTVSKRQNELIPYNDCFYKHMYEYKFIALLDIDEVIMPMKGTSWRDLMDCVVPKAVKIKKKEPASYNVRSVYFLDDLLHDHGWFEEIPKYMHMLQHVYRAKNFTKPGQYVKCFHSTEKALILHNHYPLACLGSACTSYSIDTNDAHLHHYRADCVKTLKNSCVEFKKSSVMDVNVWKFRKPLVKRVNTALRSLNYEDVRI
ncbi:hypothetical protein FQR65_LT14526 [Abscondita terminalis]|nr:hypothetical protein FQR65_LT14526 [Abscondita terminalis]